MDIIEANMPRTAAKGLEKEGKGPSPINTKMIKDFVKMMRLKKKTTRVWKGRRTGLIINESQVDRNPDGRLNLDSFWDNVRYVDEIPGGSGGLSTPLSSRSQSVMSGVSGDEGETEDESESGIESEIESQSEIKSGRSKSRPESGSKSSPWTDGDGDREDGNASNGDVDADAADAADAAAAAAAAGGRRMEGEAETGTGTAGRGEDGGEDDGGGVVMEGAEEDEGLPVKRLQYHLLKSTRKQSPVLARSEISTDEELAAGVEALNGYSNNSTNNNNDRHHQQQEGLEENGVLPSNGAAPRPADIVTTDAADAADAAAGASGTGREGRTRNSPPPSKGVKTPPGSVGIRGGSPSLRTPRGARRKVVGGNSVPSSDDDDDDNGSAFGSFGVGGMDDDTDHEISDQKPVTRASARKSPKTPPQSKSAAAAAAAAVANSPVSSNGFGSLRSVATPQTVRQAIPARSSTTPPPSSLSSSSVSLSARKGRAVGNTPLTPTASVPSTRKKLLPSSSPSPRRRSSTGRGKGEEEVKRSDEDRNEQKQAENPMGMARMDLDSGGGDHDYHDDAGVGDDGGGSSDGVGASMQLPSSAAAGGDEDGAHSYNGDDDHGSAGAHGEAKETPSPGKENRPDEDRAKGANNNNDHNRNKRNKKSTVARLSPGRRTPKVKGKGKGKAAAGAGFMSPGPERQKDGPTFIDVKEIAPEMRHTPGKRRSHRHRVPPLKFWENDNIKYAVDEMGLLETKGIFKGRSTTPTPGSRRHAQGSGGGSKKRARVLQPVEMDPLIVSDLPPLPSKGKYMQGEEECVVWNEDSCKNARRHVVMRSKNLVHHNLQAALDRPPGKSKVGSAAQAFNVPPEVGISGWLSGRLELAHGAIKDSEHAAYSTQIYVVAEGQPNALELAIAKTSETNSNVFDPETAQRFLLSPGDHFFVPVNNIYRLENHSKTAKCVIYWIIVKSSDA